MSAAAFAPCSRFRDGDYNPRRRGNLKVSITLKRSGFSCLQWTRRDFAWKEGLGGGSLRSLSRELMPPGEFSSSCPFESIKIQTAGNIYAWNLIIGTLHAVSSSCSLVIISPSRGAFKTCTECVRHGKMSPTLFTTLLATRDNFLFRFCFSFFFSFNCIFKCVILQM